MSARDYITGQRYAPAFRAALAASDRRRRTRQIVAAVAAVLLAALVTAPVHAQETRYRCTAWAWVYITPNWRKVCLAVEPIPEPYVCGDCHAARGG